MKRLRVSWLPDGKRLHLRNGTIDLIIQAFGRPAEVGRVHEAGIERVRALILEVAEDVPRLQAGEAPQTAVGRRAADACAVVPGALGPVTALNGAVADEVMAAMMQGGQMDRGFVNHRGMLAFHLTEGHSLTPLSMDWQPYARHEARVQLMAGIRTRGSAGAGWRHDHFAYGYVERIFATATSTAVAEAAMGSIAARMRPDTGAELVPAHALAPHTVLGGLPVCPVRPRIDPDEAKALMEKGRAAAEPMVASGVISLAVMELGAEHFFAGPSYISLKSLLSLEATS
jgi:ApbE superfamily uncharacterized protein (UPF0280 family)